MSRKKEKLLDKLVKRDYNNDLEEILSKKLYKEEVKNLLLDMLYKIETSYKDYEIVKKNVLSKDDYIENIIKSIKKNCDMIDFIKLDKKQKRTFIIDKEKKQILCYPMTRKLLYAISKIQKSEDIIKQEPYILNKTLTNVINIGNNINTVEPLRDFNGFAWSISTMDIENFYYNIIYQDLIILVGNQLLDEWANKNDTMVDYMIIFKDLLEKKYGKKMLEEVMEILKEISILMELNVNESFESELNQRKQEVETELNEMKNKGKYLENLTKEKKKLSKQIKKIDIILNDKEKLSEEYSNRNQELPLEQKIFSKRVLRLKLLEEREILLNKMQQITEKMNVKTFLKRKRELEYELNYLKIVEEKNIKKNILENIVLMQKKVLKALKVKIKKVNTRDELNKVLYEIRYLRLVPIDTNRNIGQIQRLNKMFNTLESNAIDKAYELKDFNEICKDKTQNINILKYIFDLNIIRLEDISLKLINEKDGQYVQFYDDSTIDEKFKLDCIFNKEDLKVRINKKIRLFDL